MTLGFRNRRLSTIRHLQRSLPKPNHMDSPVRSTHDSLQILTHDQYSSPKLSPTSVLPCPLDEFRKWFESVITPSNDGSPLVREPEAMTLATATKTGVPSARVVLLRQVDTRGFTFFTNYNSRKSQELKENPNAALAFHWKEASRQIRVVGKVEMVSETESAEYFHSRPIGSRIGAWASRQSSVIAEDELHRRVEEFEAKFGVKSGQPEVPKPEFWGGWRLIPHEVEFWAGQPSRLHDRVRYLRVSEESSDDAEWKIERLAP